MRRLWLIFAQTATVCLAVLFVVSTLRPDLLPQSRVPVVSIREPLPAPASIPASMESPARAGPTSSLREAAARAMPSYDRDIVT
jgi:serine protease DegQ